MNIKQIDEQKQLIKKIHFPLVGECTKYDDPKRFLELPLWKQNKLVDWILNKLEPSKSINHACSSYGLKHYFSNDNGGFYIKNGAFKGAMIVAGFKVANKQSQNWNFNIKQKSITNLRRI
ncbi:hypothetical protein [Companilactobacillus sp. HBUAS59699]|uniref:hypothetical protein n=1 Tax=Companilactobacillus sp. HBUAS59699 TaxID=3109358 RepID=UPI002FEEA8DB